MGREMALEVVSDCLYCRFSYSTIVRAFRTIGISESFDMGGYGKVALCEAIPILSFETFGLL